MSAASTAEPAFVAKTKAGRVTDFVDSRVGGSGILREFGRKVFPDHWSFMFGEVALYSFVILLLSGTFLTFFFDPSMAETHYDGSYVPLKGVEMSVAYSSSLNISFDIRGGLFMRQVHHWAALLFVASIAVHMLRVFFTGAFRRPREMNWVVGCVLLILAMAAGFTGYSLPDDLLSGNGLRIIDGVIKSIPVVGTYISFFLFGGEFPGTAIISRLYMLHILLVPALILLMIVLHLFMVVVHKHTQYPGPGRNDNNVVGYPLGPVYAAKAGGFFFIVFGVLALMAAFFTINPIWNYGPYDPSPVSAGTQPDWYIGFVDGALRLMPGTFGDWHVEQTWLGFVFTFNVLLPALVPAGILFTVMFAYPWIERWITKDNREHHVLDRPRNAPPARALVLPVSSGTASCGRLPVLTSLPRTSTCPSTMSPTGSVPSSSSARLSDSSLPSAWPLRSSARTARLHCMAGKRDELSACPTVSSSRFTLRSTSTSATSWSGSSLPRSSPLYRTSTVW